MLSFTCIVHLAKMVSVYIYYDARHSRAITYMYIMLDINGLPEIVSEYDQEIPQSQTADNPVAPRGRAAQPSRDTRKTN